MSIDEAVVSLEKKLGDSEVFNVRHDGNTIIVNVNFIYRVNEVPDEWEGFRVVTGRRSCW